MPDHAVTDLLRDLNNGSREAMDRLIPIVYAELRRLSANILQHERDDHTLQPTALVHEAYLRLVRQDHPDYRSRSQFYGIAARVMRQILVDHSRRRAAAKRGAGETLSLDAGGPEPRGADRMTRLDDALNDLESRDPLLAKLVELKFFAGLTAEESAELLSMAVAEVRKQLRVALAWLEQELGPSPLA